ncbi:gamma-glutamyl kinase [Thauera terpenica 58Eu]|uniref:Glutamate 5-kinase n=1 Tax=Thauera terpenica 58Eu TaxID=1348657 RepID=S9ZLH7_9RHOO|nr:glutamate 5-kinase [Thauera terpenica]EPZ15491.1 gamma-glutamyl kinase [Thauera terpenica 58Eu]MBP6760763.1 glutamate 5-kinase [Thauera sp.]
MRTKIRNARRLVVKVGSALVTNNGAGLDKDALDDWARQIAALRATGYEVTLVSSGAIAAGMQRLGWSKRPQAMSKLQAAAAVGQMGLVEAYEKAFSRHGLHTAQILLTHEDLADRSRYLNARSTLTTLLELGVVPIINENDTVVTDEIKFGDNDTLGALVANLIEAEALIILTDQQGLYTADPRRDPTATLISEGRAEDRRYEAMAGGAGTGISKGGMITKIRAAQRAARSGAHTCIASGHETDALLRLAQGEAIGTLLYATSTRLQARKQWIADHLQLAGDLIIDDGAVSALKSGRSLLPVGVLEVRGDFERGAAVACRSIAGEEVARGLVNYNASECRKIARKPTAAIKELLGYIDEPELIHRDNMVAC